MKILALDPGTLVSAYVLWDSRRAAITDKAIAPNDAVLTRVAQCDYELLAVEMLRSQGMAVGRETFETLVWIGRFLQATQQPWQLVHRDSIKLHHCGSMRAKDANIRQSLIDKYGAPGRKKQPGRTYGLKSHLWQAFAVAALIGEGGEMRLGRCQLNEAIARPA